MTDLTPNDLSHLSDAEFHSLCPQGEHAPGPEPLSPAAQALITAFLDTPLRSFVCSVHRRDQIAAVLRAAAAHLGSCNPSDELIRIAEELEGQ